MARSANRSTDSGVNPRVSAPTELSLEEVLKSYEQPINEEQAWAVCYQCCSGLRLPRPPRSVRRVEDPSSILLHRDGTVTLRDGDADTPPAPPSTERQLVQSLGVAIYRALDWGLDDSEERELSPQLERLIERMVGEDQEGGGHSTAEGGAADEGYSGQDEEDDDEEEGEGGARRPVRTFRQVMALCASRLSQAGPAPQHYQAGPAPQHYQAGHAPQHYQAGPAPQHYQAGPAPQHYQAGPAPQHYQAGHAPQHYQAGPAPQHYQAGPAPQHYQAGPAPQHYQAGPAPQHYQAVCRALLLETLELQSFLVKIRDAKQMLKKISCEEASEDRSSAELDALKHRDWARLWVQLMKDLRRGVKLKKVQEQPFDPLPSEFSLTPFEMLMQDIRARKFQLRKVMVDGDIPTRVKRNAHELILDFIRSRPPLKPVSERSLPPPPPQEQCLHDRVLAGIKQERKLRPVVADSRPFGSLPCLAQMCPCNVKSTSCIDLSVSEPRPPSRPRVLLKAPTLAEMEEMNISEEEESPDSQELRRAQSSPPTMKRDRSFSEQDLALLRGETPPSLSLGGAVRLRDTRPRSRTLTGAGPPPLHRASLPVHGWAPPSPARLSLSAVDEATEGPGPPGPVDRHQWMEEFSHPVESLALTVDEVINVRRVLVKAEMEKFLQNRELYSSLRRGKVCCCCRVKFPLFSWPASCLLCKRSVCSSCSAKMKIPSKKMAHIPVYTVGFHSSPKSHGHKSQVYKSLRSLSRRSVEEDFPHLYAHGCTLRDVCAECTKFVADIVSSSRRSLDILNNTPTREARPPAPRPPLQRQPHLEAPAPPSHAVRTPQLRHTDSSVHQ